MNTLRLIEGLESRRMLSVTAAALAGPLTIGSTWKYDDGSSVVIQAPDDYNAVDVVTTITSPLETELDSTTTDFEALNPRRGLVDYGTDYYEALTFPFGDDTRSTPPQVLFPAVMTAGKEYVSRYRSVFVNLAGDPGSTTSASNATSRTMLVSDTLQSITVPAGTFSTYQVIEQSEGETITQWIAPGIGKVQETDSNGTDAPTTSHLMSYSISGNSAAAQLAGRIVGAKLPDSIVAGKVIRSSIAVNLSNVGAATESGPVTLQVYVNATSTSATTLVGSIITRPLTLNVDQAIPLQVPILWNTTGLDDAYSLTLVVTDSTGNAITNIPVISSANDIGVAPASTTTDPFILQATTRAIVVTVQNNGNVRTEESGQLQVLGSTSVTSPSDTSGATTLFQIPTVFNLKPGQTRKFVFHLSQAKAATINDYTWLIANVISADAGSVYATQLPLSG